MPSDKSICRGEILYRLPNIINKRLQDPHIVILGAGASKAAVPVDKNGLSVPLLSNIHTLLDLTNDIRELGYTDDIPDNFETFFSNISESGNYPELTKRLEGRVRNFFKRLQIPDEITLYDYLILSLTKKDAIISFNWDPFLMQAYRRNINVGNLPQLIFPHGNVGVGLCNECKVKGYADCLCPNCLKALSDMKLLYPVKKKNYYDGNIIENEWILAKNYLSHAAGITVFGYSAPESDLEAYTLLKESYKQSKIDINAPFTIINLDSERDNQKKKWEDIYDNRMLAYHTSFQESILWLYPRVSLETIFDAILQQQPRVDVKSFQQFSSLEELQLFVRTITEFDMAV